MAHSPRVATFSAYNCQHRHTCLWHPPERQKEVKLKHHVPRYMAYKAGQLSFSKLSCNFVSETDTLQFCIKLLNKWISYSAIISVIGQRPRAETEMYNYCQNTISISIESTIYSFIVCNTV